jgi:hypothetical protein
LLFAIVVCGCRGQLPTSNHERACLDAPDPVNGLAGSGSSPNERHQKFPLCKRDGLAYPHVFGVRPHRAKILVRNCNAEDVVTL